MCCAGRGVADVPPASPGTAHARQPRARADDAARARRGRHRSRSSGSATSCSTTAELADRPLGRSTSPTACTRDRWSTSRRSSPTSARCPVTGARRRARRRSSRSPRRRARSRPSRSSRAGCSSARSCTHQGRRTTAPRPPDPLVETIDAAVPVRPRRLRGRARRVRHRARPRAAVGWADAHRRRRRSPIVLVARRRRSPASTCARTSSPTCSAGSRWRSRSGRSSAIVGARRRRAFVTMGERDERRRDDLRRSPARPRRSR